MIPSKSRILQPFTKCRTIFLCCDIQEKLVDRIPNYWEAVHVSNRFARLHEVLTPRYSTFVATEQYPQGVGHLHPDIQLPDHTPVFPKVQTSMVTDDVRPYLVGDRDRGIEPVQQAVLWGHETHVCILQTVDSLLQMGIRVAVAADGCGAQGDVAHPVTLMQLSSWEGVCLSTCIGIATQLVRESPEVMKPIMKLIRSTNKEVASKSLLRTDPL